MTLAETDARPQSAVVGRLSALDRFLPIWILAAMAAGLALGRLVPDLAVVLSAVQVDGVSLPIAVGLLVMMYPVLTAAVTPAGEPALGGSR